MAPLSNSAPCHAFAGSFSAGRTLPPLVVFVASWATHVAADCLPDTEDFTREHKCSEDEQLQQLFLLQKSYTEEPNPNKPKQKAHCGAERNLTFLHIPKTAGTAIEDAGHSLGLTWGRFGSYDGCYTLGYAMVGTAVQCSPWHLPPRFMDLPNMYSKAEEVFCVTRHPYDRAISEYRYAVQAASSSGSMRGYDASFRELAGIDRCTADGLNTFLKVALREFQLGNYFLLDGHLIPQAHYIVDAAERRWCHTVLPMHDFPDNFNRLMSKHGLPIAVDGNASNTNLGACQSLGFSHLSGEVKALLKEVYAQDFELLGYKMCEGDCHEIKTRWASHCDCGPPAPLDGKAFWVKQQIREELRK